MMRGSAICSSLCHPDFHRQDQLPLSIPAVRPSCRSTPEASAMCGGRTTSKVAEEFGGRNPFTPSLQSSHDSLDSLLIFAAVAASLALGAFSFLFDELRF